MSTKRFASVSDMGNEAHMGPSLLEPCTPHDDDRFHQVLGLWVGTAGTANLVFKGDPEVVADGIPLHVGWNPVRCIGVKTGGTADGIFLGY